MLLNPKKVQQNEQNWSIILSPLRNEIDKKKVSQKIANVFSLSTEEASDLVSNTPIILLDNLTYSVAAKLKDYFRSTGAEMMLTNDVFQKRKCYRTVWPEPPSLSFLQGGVTNEESETGESVETDDHEALETDEALNEIRSLVKEDIKRPENIENASISFLSGAERDQLLEELERWRRECVTLREEQKRLRSALEDSKYLEEGEHRDIRLMLAGAEEKYEALKEEYREARRLYEEKISSLMLESGQWKKKVEEANESFSSLQKEKNNFLQGISQKEEQISKLAQSHESSARETQAKLERSDDENERHKLKIKELSEKLETVQKAKEDLDRAINEQTEKISYWSGKHQSVAQKLEIFQKTEEEEKGLREKVEFKQKELEKNQLRLVQDIEGKSRELRQWEIKCVELDEQIARLREIGEGQEKMIQSHLTQLEARDRELENARRQLRELHTQLEQRDAVQKRAQLANQMVEKEGALKQLVKEQEKMEMEIREREESLRRILSEQELVEKDIIQAKQAQRHMMEQAKREQAPRLKTNREDQTSNSGQTPKENDRTHTQ